MPGRAEPGHIGHAQSAHTLARPGRRQAAHWPDRARLCQASARPHTGQTGPGWAGPGRARVGPPNGTSTRALQTHRSSCSRTLIGQNWLTGKPHGQNRIITIPRKMAHSLELHRIKPWTPPITVLYFQVPQTYGTSRLIVRAVTGLVIMSAIIQCVGT